MTTIDAAPTPPAEIARAGVAIVPLAEFGKSLDHPDLDEWLVEFSERNENSGQVYEISNSGHLLIMPPTGIPGILHEGELLIDLALWARSNGGFVFGPTARFRLPDQSRPGPDAAWVSADRRSDLMRPENRPFARFAPDFVAEIKSPSNTTAELAAKIRVFVSYGTRLAWLIDAATRTVTIFRPDREPEALVNPEFVDGDADVFPGFRFAVRERIFDYMTDLQSNPQ